MSPRSGRGTTTVEAAPPAQTEPETEASGSPLLSIGAAAAQAGVTERALRYYQELGLLDPAHTKGGMRRYSEKDLARVARIRELQTVLALNLDEIAVVLHHDDRTAEIRAAYYDDRTGDEERLRLLRESLGLATEMRRTVETKRQALDAFLHDLDARIARVRTALGEDPTGT